MSEEQVKVASLVEKLSAWVANQPEYPYLFLADRGRRKRAASIVAKRLLLIPSITPDPAGVDRATHRKMQSQVKTVVGGFQTNMSRRAQRQHYDAVKMRNRYMRLGMERAHELALQDDRDRTAARLAVEAMERELEAADGVAEVEVE